MNRHNIAPWFVCLVSLVSFAVGRYLADDERFIVDDAKVRAAYEQGVKEGINSVRACARPKSQRLIAANH